MESSETPFYLVAAKFIEKNTLDDAVIGTPNAGGVGYFTNRRVVNIDGLSNNPEFLDSIKNLEGHTYLKEIGVGYIFRVPGYEKYELHTHMLDGKIERLTGNLYKYFPDR